MRKILLVSIFLMSGCAVVKSESGMNEAVALGSACAVNVHTDSYQVACAGTDSQKVVSAIKSINKKIVGKRI